MVKNILLLFIESLWLLLPASLSNMSPILAKKLIPNWNTPVDFGKRCRGQEIFGSHKTYRGFAIGTLAGLLVFYIQQIIFRHNPFIRSISLIDYQSISTLFGAWLGFCALLGDLLKSFFKRRLKIAPGKAWLFFDEVDWIVGALLGVSVIYVPSLKLISASLIIGVSLHFIIRWIAFILGLVSEPL